MAEPINLDQLDPPILEQTQFGSDMKRWLSNIVDILNANLQVLSNALFFLIQTAGVDIGGGGAGPINVPVVGLTTGGYVVAQIVSTSNPGITILTVTPALNGFNITFSADPGASAIIVYQAFTEEP